MPDPTMPVEPDEAVIEAMADAYYEKAVMAAGVDFGVWAPRKRAALDEGQRQRTREFMRAAYEAARRTLEGRDG